MEPGAPDEASSRRAVALLSGGLDSGTALALWRERGGEVALCLTADYGQRSAAAEARAARALAERLGLAWRAVELPWLGAVARSSGSALVPGGAALPRRAAADPGDAASAAAVWVPARNLVLIAAGAAFAEALGAATLLVGFNREEAETFADNSAAFVAAVDAVLGFATRNGVGVSAPTLAMGKREIAAHARRLGLGRADFWSCYEAGPRPCGTCESCVRSRRAWQA